MNSTNAPFANPILALPRPAKRAVVLLVDLALCVLTVWLAFYLRLGELVPLSGAALWAVAGAVALALPIFIVSGLYRAIFRYSGWPALLAVARAVAVYALLYAAVFTAIEVPGVPRTVGLIQPLLLLLFVGASRALARHWLGEQYQGMLRRAERPRVLIYGAGQSGRQLAAAMQHSPELQVAGLLDDDERLHGHVLNALPVYNPADLPVLARTLGIRDVLLAMPNIGRKRRNEVIEQMRAAHVAVRTLPSMNDLAQGKVSLADVRELDLDDLLGREPVAPNHILLAKNIVGKVVLVTGAGGSIGSELCRQIWAVRPAKLLLLEQSEFALYAIHHELEDKRTAGKNGDVDGAADGSEIELLPLLASVQDAARLHEIMQTWQPHTVYHAAAYKHVPLVEHNPAEGVKNNVLGTLRTAQAALQAGVSDFVLVSTDKAVRPTNIMGASKRLAEMVLQALAAASAGAAGTAGTTRFAMVRFGNVLGSSGSVVPKFRQQIRDGGPLTLTHPEITRYFMSIPEAAQLVIQAGAMAKGGEVFVLDMGQPVRIIDLARRMIELSGLSVQDDANPTGDIAIELSGLRPGEKLYEELLLGDNPSPTLHPRILKAQDDFLPWAQLEGHLAELDLALQLNDVPTIRLQMQHLVPGYTPNEAIVDWVYLQQQAG